MGSSVVFHLQVVYSLGLSKPDLPLGVKPTRKDWGTCDAPFCAQPSSCPQVVGPQGDLWEDRGFPPALPIPQLWNKGHERGFHQTHSAHPCLPQNSHWAGPSQLVMWPYQWPGHFENSLGGQSPELQLESWVWYKGSRLPDERFHVLDPSDVAFTCLTQVLACSTFHLEESSGKPQLWPGSARPEFLTHAHCRTMEPSLQTEERFWR